MTQFAVIRAAHLDNLVVVVVEDEHGNVLVDAGFRDRQAFSDFVQEIENRWPE